MMSLYDHLPTLDLHGIDRDYARILINDFIADHYKIKTEQVVIVHGNGTGIIKKVTQETLRKKGIILMRWGYGKKAEYDIEYEEYLLEEDE